MRRKSMNLMGFLLTLGVCLFLSIFIIGNLLLSARTNILIIGLDSRENEGNFGRTDTMIITTIDAVTPYIGVLSIPRDLWVNIPGYGENRINTAHFFAENDSLGSGPYAAIEVVENNFSIDLDYFVRTRFDGLVEIIDVVGGINIDPQEPMAGYSPGEHHLNGEQALAFARDRSGSDDFYRMGRVQLVLKSFLLNMLDIDNWKYIPQVIEVFDSTIDTNIPLYLIPKFAIALLRTGPDNVDFRIISREMITPFTTDGGAAVLAPKWELIQPILFDIFGQ
jgi:LCP family protein required for cell wall assembly